MSQNHPLFGTTLGAAQQDHHLRIGNDNVFEGRAKDFTRAEQASETQDCGHPLGFMPNQHEKRGDGANHLGRNRRRLMRGRQLRPHVKCLPGSPGGGSWINLGQRAGEIGEARAQQAIIAAVDDVPSEAPIARLVCHRAPGDALFVDVIVEVDQG